MFIVDKAHKLMSMVLIKIAGDRHHGSLMVREADLGSQSWGSTPH